MLVSTVFAFFFFFSGLMVVLPALMLAYRGFFPGWVGAAETACRERKVATGVVGVLGGGLWFIVCAAAMGSGHGAAAFAGATGITLLFLYSMVGVSGLAAHVGHRLPSPDDLNRPWKATLRGGIVLELPFLIPIAGWLILFPLALITGIGAATLGLAAGTSRREDAPLQAAGWSPARTATAPEAVGVGV